MSTTKKVTDFPEMEKRFVISEGGYKLTSPRVGVEVVAVIGRTGRPYDALQYVDQPNVNVLVWGTDYDGKIRIGIHRQARSQPDNPENPESFEPVFFTGLAGGYFDKNESVIEAATREANEELGLVGAGISIITVELPSHPYHNMDSALYKTWTQIAFVEVDLTKLPENLKGNLDEDEIIDRIEFVSLKDIFLMIRDGKDRYGAFLRSADTNSAILIFLAHHPQFLSQLS